MATDGQIAKPPLLAAIVHGSVRRSAILSACVSSVIVGAGWLLWHFAMSDAIPSGFALLGGVLLFPGMMVSYLYAAIFGLGGHGVENMWWAVSPTSWLVYFIFLGWRFDPRRKTQS